ncbi:hypothetical protein FZ983_20020 [Azospirillum sp. B21]|uniref:hypothetical protein n=1 Tax=Azospirillum sp. B21 TaxID=2607496 RepID=UPI0011F05853|nr:hypothetical protein [Azospirillum sp. B21]KAA0577876.1 hypothetical protein FZ983_20020 [Azospirillum sp. B21]
MRESQNKFKKSTNANRKKSVILNVYEQTHFREMSRVVKLLLDDGTFTPVVHFGCPYPFLFQDMQSALEMGVVSFYTSGTAVASDGAQTAGPLARHAAACPGGFDGVHAGSVHEVDAEHSAPCADLANGWQIGTPGPGGAVRVSGETDSDETHFLRWRQLRAATGESRLQKRLGDVDRFAGSRLRLRLRARADRPLAVRICLQQYYGDGLPPVHTQDRYVLLSPDWTSLTADFDVPPVSRRRLGKNANLMLRVHFPGWGVFQADLLAVTFDKGSGGRTLLAPDAGPQASDRPWVLPWRRFAGEIFRLWRLKRAVAAMLRKTDARALLFPEDNPSYATGIPIRVGHAHGVPSIVLPYTIATALEPASVLERDPRHRPGPVGCSLLRLCGGQWLYEHGGSMMSRLPIPEALALQWTGGAPDRPWIAHSGDADVIAVENAAMADHYRREGLSGARLVEVGALYDDVLAQGMRNREKGRALLARSFGLPADRPLLLCAPPPDGHHRGGHRCEFATFDDLIEYWAERLAQVKDFGILVCPHPTAIDRHFVPFRERGIAVATGWDTARLVPLCDLYVASVSATIRWAIACGHPVLNYDVYRYGYTDFAGVPGVIRVEGRDAFAGQMRRMTSDPACLAELARLQRQESRRWGRLDGQAQTRLLALLNRMTVHDRPD